MVSLGESLIGSQFFLTLGSDLTSLDGIHCVIGQVVEGLDVLRTINEVICDNTHRPYKDVRITHTVILDDPFQNPRGFREVSRSPSPSAERLRGGRIAADEDIDETADETELAEMRLEREAKARATILEIIGDLPDAEIAPPENVLFVCKLNSVTTDDDLEIIFSRFGKIVGCEVIRDRKTGDSLQYAFIEFEDQKSCEQAYFKMDNVLIDDRRIHVDFSQSVSKMQWRGKGRGFIMKDGSKDTRLDFNNYNKPNRDNNRGGGRNDRGDRGDRRDRNDRERDRDNSQSGNDSNRQNDRRNTSPLPPPQRRYDRPNDRRDRPRSRSRSPYGRQRFDNRRGRFDNNRRNSPDRNFRRDSDRSHDRNAYRRNSPDRNQRDARRDDHRRNEVERKHERNNRSPSPDTKRQRSKRSASVEKQKSHPKDQKEKKSHKKSSKKSKNKKDKKHKKKSGKKHKKHSSSESSSDSDSSSSSSSSSS